MCNTPPQIDLSIPSESHRKFLLWLCHANRCYHADKVRLQLIDQTRERTFSSQVDAVVDGLLLRVSVDNNTSIECHVKWSIHDGAIVAHDIQTFVNSVSPEIQQTFHLIHANHNYVMFILYNSVIILY